MWTAHAAEPTLPKQDVLRSTQDSGRTHVPRYLRAPYRPRTGLSFRPSAIVTMTTSRGSSTAQHESTMRDCAGRSCPAIIKVSYLRERYKTRLWFLYLINKRIHSPETHMYGYYDSGRGVDLAVCEKYICRARARAVRTIIFLISITPPDTLPITS